MQLLRIDWNVVWTIINLLVLFVALRHFLYNPVMKVMDERKKMIDGQIADAENQKKQAGELKAQYAKKLEEAHAESADIMDKARKSAQAEYENRINAADAEAQRIIKKELGDYLATGSVTPWVGEVEPGQSALAQAESMKCYMRIQFGNYDSSGTALHAIAFTMTDKKSDGHRYYLALETFATIKTPQG